MLVINNDIVFGDAIEPPEVVQKRGHIGYQNIVTADNITASSAAAGFAASGLANPLTAQRWKPEAMNAQIDVDYGSAVDVDYFGMASNTFGDSGVTIKIWYSTDGATYTEIDSATPTTNRPIMFIFNTITAQYWRVSFEGATAPELGVLYIGELLVVQREIYGGHTPVTMGRDTKRIANRTEGGQFAGISVIRESVKTSYNWQHLGALWYRQTMEPFIIAARTTPFFIAWRNVDYPDEIGYVWAVDDPRPVNMGIKDLMQLQLDVEGFTDE